MAEGGGPVGQAQTGDGVAGDRGLGVEEGDHPGLLVGGQGLEAVPVEGSGVGDGGVDGPGGGVLGEPVAAEVVCGLGEVVGHRPDVGGLPGPGQRDVGEFSAAAVGEQMGPVRRRPLTAVNRCRVPVTQPVLPCLLSAERHLLAVVGA